ncbi:MAG: biotin--acetyl-CoA-carboxylase ligase [Desulfovibrionaceae bacterium]|nr:biotin--acetyl-CoA-carboxylase ligase [Desulfovibrionaceae bacterium]
MPLSCSNQPVPSVPAVSSVLHDARLPAPLLCCGQVSSVLDIAHSVAAAGVLPPWGSVLASQQLAGRGQMRRVWASPVGNVYAALRLPLCAPFTSSAAAPAVGALLVQALQQVCGLPLLLKWPNDIVAAQGAGCAKVGGILLEERGGVLLAGVGINLLSCPPPELLRKDAAMPAISLCNLVHKSTFSSSLPTPQELWLMLVHCAFSAYNKPRSYADHWKEAAESRLLWRGRSVMLDDDGALIRGTLLGLGDQGGLRLGRGGQVSEFLSGSLRLS